MKTNKQTNRRRTLLFPLQNWIILILFEIIIESACIFECGTWYIPRLRCCALHLLTFVRLLLQISEQKKNKIYYTFFGTLTCSVVQSIHSMPLATGNCKLEIYNKTSLNCAVHCIYWYVGVTTSAVIEQYAHDSYSLHEKIFGTKEHDTASAWPNMCVKCWWAVAEVIRSTSKQFRLNW